MAKLSSHSFTRFWDLHAWAGVVGGLVLHLMFLTGGIALFRGHLETWGEPLAQGTSRDRSLQEAMDRGLAALGTTPADFWFHPPKDGHGAARLTYRAPGQTERTRAWIDPERPRVVPKRERLSDFLYGVHFLWHDATGDWLSYCAGLLAVALLVALVTGVLIHLKDIVRQFHQFRPEKSRRVLWSDMHKVLGVMGLPFQLAYAYTGAFLVLAPLVLQGFAGPVFGGDDARAESMAWGATTPAQADPGAATAVLTLDELVAHARAARPDVILEPYRLRHHGHANGLFEAWGDEGTPSTAVGVRVRETDGAILDVQQYGEGASGAARRWINSLHYAYFGGPALRLLLFVLALATCGTILTGNWVWLARRESRSSSLGNRVLARLTAGVGAGTLVAVAAMFVASRVIPLELAGRGAMEELVFVGALLACITWALVSRNERGLWWQQLAVAGALFLAVPPLAARWSSAGLFGSGPRIAAVTGVDIALLATACVLGGTALALRAATPFHGAATGGLPLAGWPGRGLATILKAGALAAAAGGVACWSQVENPTAAVLVALSALSVAATLVVLLAPIFPRAIWALMFAWSLVVVVLLPLGGCRG